MRHELKLSEFIELAQSAKLVAVYREISADRLTPISIVENLSEEMLEGAVLESGQRHEDAGRYSFIAFDPMAQFTNLPFTALRQLLAELKYASSYPDAALMNSMVGYISYDAVRMFEPIPDRHLRESALPDLLFKFYRTTLIFDHLQQKLLINHITETGPNLEHIFGEIQDKISTLITKISAPAVSTATISKIQNSPTTPEMDIADEQFIEMVNQAKQYINAGEAFQIVLSRCFKRSYRVKPFDIYRALRRVSPAPYMFYFPCEHSVIVGASPEKLISVRQRHVTINPIAGTRPRTQENQDQQISDELLNDKKERAEHIMLVDLARNDLGAVCQPGTIKVEQLMQVKHFSHVSHLTSVVSGQLRDDKDTFDALAAAFPAGTLSGAPKIRAMQIIDELENSRRGIYGGAICRIDNQGNLDSCIAIRMAVLTEGQAVIRTGAGIVYDSDPEAEARETRYKAQSMLEALRVAEEEQV